MDYSFTIATTTGGITGYSSGAFDIATSRFEDANSGLWSIAFIDGGKDLALEYTGAAASAVPEPLSYVAILGLAAMACAMASRRAGSSRT
jgi:hypothetical protein